MGSYTALVFVAFIYATCGPVSGQGCEDKMATFCSRHKQAGHCKSEQYERLVKQMCPKTCGLCSDGGTCEDVNPALCQMRKSRGECDNPTHFTVNMCKKTCSFCSKVVKVTEQPPPCQDEWSDCKRVANMGLCGKLGKLRERCKRSCMGCANPRF